MYLLVLGSRFQSFRGAAALICGNIICISVGLQNILHFPLLF